MTNPHLPPTLRYDAVGNPLLRPEGEEAQNQVDRAVPCSMPVLAAEPHVEITSPTERPIHLIAWQNKPNVFLVIAVFCCIFVGCETANYAPAVTQTMTRGTAGAKQDADLVKLERGRTLFVHRCIECHTLPAMWKYSREDWPKIVNDMSHRASLKPQDREAVIAYILAVRAQQ